MIVYGIFSPSPSGSLLTKSGVSSRFSLTSMTAPETGATMFETDLTDSITPISSKQDSYNRLSLSHSPSISNSRSTSGNST